MNTLLTEQQLIQIVSQTKVSSLQAIANNQWCFFTCYAPLPLVWQSFIAEFTSPYIGDMRYRAGLHTFSSEVYQSCQN